MGNFDEEGVLQRVGTSLIVGELKVRGRVAGV